MKIRLKENGKILEFVKKGNEYYLKNFNGIVALSALKKECYEIIK